MPPTRATPTTISRKSRISLGSDSASPKGTSAAVMMGSSSSAIAQPANRRLRVSAARDLTRRARPLTSAWVIMWTSMDPESMVVVTPTPRENSCAILPRREAPSTSCVAFTPRAKSSRAFGTSSPTTWW